MDHKREDRVDFYHCLIFHDDISSICKYTHFHLRNIGNNLILWHNLSIIKLIYNSTLITT